MDIFKAVDTALTAVGKTIDYVKTHFTDHLSNNSMVKLTSITRAEPIVVVSQDCANIEYLPLLMNNLCSIFSGYYLQAVAIMTNASVDVEVIKILDALNPNRDETGYLLQSRHATESAATYGNVFVKENYTYSLPTTLVMAMEDAQRQSDVIKVIYESENLAVGKLLNVDFQVACGDNNEERKVTTIPISVRLAPVILAQSSINYFFKHKKEDTGIIERFHSARAGRIEYIRDLIFCGDLIREYRKAALMDTSGTIQEIQRRVGANRGYGLLTKNPSMAMASNMFVISSETAREVEGATGLRFSKALEREKLLKDTYAMIVAVVDQEHELISLYFDGLANPSTISVRSLKASSKTKGPDVGDIMRTLMEGRAPTF